MNTRKLSTLGIVFFIIAILSSSASAQVNATWEVEVGDTAVYYLDEVYFSLDGSETENIAPIFGDANRTNYFAVTAKESSYLNYSLALMNGSQLLNNQQLEMIAIPLGGQSVIIPNGSLPIVLPISIPNQSNYLQYLSSNVQLAQLAITGIFDQFNLSASEIAIDSVYRSNLFNITAEAKLSDLEDLTSQLLPEVNNTGIITLGENQTINEILSDLIVSYNSTDGMLMEFGINAAINTTAIIDGQEITRIATFNATMIRQSFTPISDVLSDTGLISDLNDASFLMIGLIPALLVMKRRRI